MRGPIGKNCSSAPQFRSDPRISCTMSEHYSSMGRREFWTAFLLRGGPWAVGCGDSGPESDPNKVTEIEGSGCKSS